MRCTLWLKIHEKHLFKGSYPCLMLYENMPGAAMFECFDVHKFLITKCAFAWTLTMQLFGAMLTEYPKHAKVFKGIVKIDT